MDLKIYIWMVQAPQNFSDVAQTCAPHSLRGVEKNTDNCLEGIEPLPAASNVDVLKDTLLDHRQS